MNDLRSPSVEENPAKIEKDGYLFLIQF